MIADWDDAYANARISRRRRLPARWEALARLPRDAGARLREIAYGAHPRQRSTSSCRRPRRGASSSSCTAATGGVRPRPGRTSPPGRWRAAGRWRCPATCWRPRRASRDHRDDRRAVDAAAARWRGRSASHSAGGHLVARQVCADSRLAPDVRARLAGCWRSAASRPAPAAPARAERRWPRPAEAAPRARRSRALAGAASMPGSATPSGRSSCARPR